MMRKFALQVLLIDLLGIGIGGGLLYVTLGQMDAAGFSLAFIITSINALSGFYVIDKNFRASMSQFMSTVFGSMFVRLMLLGAIIILVLVTTNLPEITFISGLFISYIIKSVLEIIYINRKSVNKSD